MVIAIVKEEATETVPCIVYDIGADIVGRQPTARDQAIATRLAWRKYSTTHFTEATLFGVRELLLLGARNEALELIEEAMRSYCMLQQQSQHSTLRGL